MGDTKRKRRSAAEWSEIVSAWRASGLALGTYAARHGLNAGTLGWWRTQVSKGRVTPASKRQVKTSSLARRSARPSKAVFAEVKVTPVRPATGRIEVVARSGHVVRIEGVVDPSALRSVLEAVEQC